MWNNGCAGYRRWGSLETNRRVVRGGSWNNNQDNARAAYRNNNTPDNRNNNLGFRVVCSSHIVRPPSKAQASAAICLPVANRPGLETMPAISGNERRLRFALRGEGFLMAQRRPAHPLDSGRAYIKSRCLLGDSSETPYVACLQPPSNLPNSATLALTC
jgi:hypothetical protein